MKQVTERLHAPVVHYLRRLLLSICSLCCLAATASQAGQLTRQEIERRFPPPFQVGEKLSEIAVWPLRSELEPAAGPVAYAFESIDLAPIPGFEGTPINLLVAIDRQGRFLDVEVLRQHEPVFLGGLGPVPLQDFVRQYAGKSLHQEITIASNYGNVHSTAAGNDNRVVLDGVSKATASIRIVNQTVLASALSVARSRLGFASPRQHGPPSVARQDVAESLDFAALLRGGYIAQLRLRNDEVEKLFAGSDLADADPEATQQPAAGFIDLYIGYLNAPTIGRSLLGEAAYRQLMASTYHEQHLFWIAAAGRYPIIEEGFVPGTAPARLALHQDGLPLELRDFGGEEVKILGAPALSSSRVFQVNAHTGLDPARALELRLLINRSKGAILPRSENRQVSLAYAAPARLFLTPPTPLPEWLTAWRSRWPDIVLVTLGLTLLGIVLQRPLRWLPTRRRLQTFRMIWLGLVIAYLGWYAQGQLSIVHLTSVVKALRNGQPPGALLYDPIALLLIAFLPISFFLWGRGTFCGWLCPFGALQELVGGIAKRLSLPQRKLPPALARLLHRGRFWLLFGLLLLAALAPDLAAVAVEVEPFKTAITVGFQRSWPYLLYAIGLLALGAIYYKFFCRYLCPLGAFMVLGGKLRRPNWLPRRPECGSPCQVCRNACAYDAISRDGTIRYDDCFQCLDCVVIYRDDTRCLPLIRAAKASTGAAPQKQ